MNLHGNLTQTPQLPLPLPPSLLFLFLIHRQNPLIKPIETRIKPDVILTRPLIPPRKNSILALPLLLPLILTRISRSLLVLLRRLLVEFIPRFAFTKFVF